jgi:hypothetical protein
MFIKFFNRELKKHYKNCNKRYIIFFKILQLISKRMIKLLKVIELGCRHVDLVLLV